MMMLDEVEYKNKQQTPNLLQNQLLNFKVVSGVKNTIIQTQISFGKVWKNSYLFLLSLVSKRKIESIYDYLMPE